MIEYFLEGTVPSKKNQKIFNTKTHRMFPSKRYQEWHEYASLTLRRKVTECITEKCYVILIFCNDTNRRKDPDNGVSSVFDLLTDIGAWTDDCWQIVRNHHVFNIYEKNKPWCKIMIFKPEEKESYKVTLINCIEQYE